MNRPDTLPIFEPTQPTRGARPLVLVPACNRQLGHHPFHVVGRKYVEAVRLAGALPMVVPSADPADIDELLAMADGILLTGSPSNVHPRHFGEPVHDTALPLDPLRDGWTLPLVPRAVELGIPVMLICRGFQEANVALGGSLHQAIHEQPGRIDHRNREADPVEVQYGPAHRVQVEPGGLLEALLAGQTDDGTFEVNSLHGQGVNRLASVLRVEARAPDGTIEAFSHATARGFFLGVQWHPEWHPERNPISMKLLGAFGAACRSFRTAQRETLRERPRVP